MRRVSVVTAAAALIMFAGTANAHPKLVSATPAANATVAKPARIQLRFSEKLVSAFSKADLIMAAMPGMPEMKIASTAALAADGQTLVITPKAPLSSGRYNVAWHVVSTDTHKVAGNDAFAVK
ncbi:copper resistance protein CopC [Sphingomonas sp. MA1305]|uniref:copper homeostasis periplasmic binding protein CopC n=1 Tax=Sphingomonas sp. MA1305 TaxID=2479204 RepID=UPI0018DF62CB|nr:copper homeostasis periplasmic binding protein CopC [Sphingomonas sp. MA1305]MBI0477295.1 copper resistance protein CopC [Sphingomonas sp. MA1305]